MSLAMFAAPIDNSSDSTELMHQKRSNHNRTQKRPPSERVNNVLAKLHESMSSMGNDDSNENLGDFNPPPPPQSIGAARAKAAEENKHEPVSYHSSTMQPENSVKDMFRTLGRPPAPSSSTNYSDLDLNHIEANTVEPNEYFQKYLPMMNKRNPSLGNLTAPSYTQSQSYTQSVAPSDNNRDDLLLQKINYMINLLEEQQDERTGNVTEEVVLYSFLGVFIIYLIDSFVRVGKYTR
jgi:hypothetical protein